jgi:hypothetical protein
MTTTAQYGVALYGDSQYGLLVLNCAGGSYTITGGDATFLYNQAVIGDAGSYVFTGNDATLDYDQILQCEAGSFTLTGNDCTFLYDQTIYAGAFSFVWSGQQAGLIKDAVLDAESGAYTITGGIAELLIDHVVSCLAGNYVYTGKDATLQTSITPVIEIVTKGGLPEEKKRRKKEKESREELEAIVKREFDILDGTYQPEVVKIAKQQILPKIQEIDYTQYQIALAQVNALLLQAKIAAAEYEAELDDEEALLMLL